MASRGRFSGHRSWLQFCKESVVISASILLSNSHHFSHDRAAIGPRSWSWSFVDRCPIEWRRFHHVSSPIAARSRRDRGSIEPRSWSSSTNRRGRQIDLQVKCMVRSRACDICFDEDLALLVLPHGVR